MGQFLNVLGGNSGGSGGVTGAGTSTALFSSTASTTLVSSVTETTLIGTGTGTKTTPANYFSAGSTLVIEATGFYSSAAVDTLTIKIKAGATVVASTGAVAYGALTNKVFTVRALVTCRTAGASGTFIVNTLYETAGSALIPQDSPMLNSVAVTLDTTGTLAWDFTGQWSANSASDTITGTNFAMYTIGSATGGTTSPAGTTGDIQINTAGAFAALTPGTGVSTFLATPTSANLAAAITNETGSGALVFGTAPTLTSPVITMNTAVANPSYAEGLLFYDQTDKTLGYYNENSSVTVNVGQEQLIRVINNTGSTIANGVPVYVSGAGSSLPQISPASASAEATSKVIGLTTNSITNGSTGYVTNSGVVHGMDTTGYALGVPVFLGTSAGTLTSTAPSGSNYIVQVGSSRISNAVTGEFVVTPLGGRIATSGGTGTVTVVASGSLTSTALVTGGGTTTLQTPSATATMDSSGNISTPGTLTVGNAATTAGAIVLTQGTTQSTGTTNITLQAPTGVTSYIRTLPAAVGTSGFVFETVAGSVQTETLVGVNGTGNVSLTTNPVFVTPQLGTVTSGNVGVCTVDGTNLVGFRGAPQNSQSTAYTTVLADAGKCLFHPVGDANARTFTIDSNANVPQPIGTIHEFINMSPNVVTISITSDTMTLLPAGTTGSRSLAQYGRASAEKITSTSWIISGNASLT